MMEQNIHVVLTTCYLTATIGWKGKVRTITKMTLTEMELVLHNWVEAGRF